MIDCGIISDITFIVIHHHNWACRNWTALSVCHCMYVYPERKEAKLRRRDRLAAETKEIKQGAV